MGEFSTGVSKKQSSFGRDVITLGLGTTVAQVITILIAPILTRLYSPDTFGLAALFVSLTGILTVIVCLRYEMAIVLPQSDEEAANLMALSILVAITISLLTIPIIWFGGNFILQLLKSPDLEPYLLFIPPTVLLGGIFLALNYWNSRTRHFGRLSFAKISNSLITSAAQLGAGLLGVNTGGALIGSTIIGSLTSTSILVAQILRDDFSFFRKNIHQNEIVLGLRRYRKFPLFDTLSSLLNAISWQLPTFLLASFFSTTEVGFYALGNRLLRIPMNLIGSSIAQVFYQRASEASLSGSLPRVVENVFRSLVYLGMFPMLILTIIGRDLFIVVFGQNWAEAGVYAQILSIWMFVWFISSPISVLFRVLEAQEFGLVINTIIFSTRFITLGIGGYLGSTYLALTLFSVSGIIIYGYMCLALVLRAGVPWSNIAQILLSNFLIFIPAAIVLLTMKYLHLGSVIVILVAGFILMLYGYYLYRRDSTIRTLLATFRKRLDYNSG